MKLFTNTFVYMTHVNCSYVGLFQEEQWVLKLYYTTVLNSQRKVSHRNIVNYHINNINWGYPRNPSMGRLRGGGVIRDLLGENLEKSFLRFSRVRNVRSECELDRCNTLNKTYKISTSYLEVNAIYVNSLHWVIINIFFNKHIIRGIMKQLL